MKYWYVMISFGAICIVSGLAVIFWLWWYSERSIRSRLRASSVGVGTSIPHAADNSNINSIVQPLLAEEHGSGSASMPQRDSLPAEESEAHQQQHQQQQQQQQDEAALPVDDAGEGTVAAPRVDAQQEEQRNHSNNSSSNRKSSPPEAVETLVGETTPGEVKGLKGSLDSPVTLQSPEESRASPSAAQEEKESNNSSSNISGSPVARADGIGDGEEGNGAGGGTGELGELREAPSSSEFEGEPATAR